MFSFRGLATTATTERCEKPEADGQEGVEEGGGWGMGQAGGHEQGQRRLVATSILITTVRLLNF